MKIHELIEGNVVKFEFPEQKKKRTKKEEQVKALKNLNFEKRQEQLKSLVRQSEAETKRKNFKVVD